MLAAILLLQAAPAAAGRVVPGRAPGGQASLTATLKQKVLEIPPQSMVQVKLKTKEKLRGRLGQVTDEGFVIKVAQGQKIEDRTVAFSDVKAIKAANAGSHVGRWIVVGVAAGAIFAVLSVVALLNSNS
jgi:hypothetical protein